MGGGVFSSFDISASGMTAERLRMNVNPVMEMLDMVNASRGYEANVMAISAAKQMILKALVI